MRSRPFTGGAASPGHTLAPGTMLAGRYQIEKVIGTGGMSVVYSARDRRFRAIVRRCAVKEMYDTIADAVARQRARENFEREANLLASLSHHAIPKVYDYFTESERHYLVYEFIEGQDLARILHQRARPLAPEKVVEWGLQLTSVLAMLHRSEPPIIFRDLKPSNVMMRADGQIVLIDFGIAKHFQSSQKGTMIGTEGYAPPEQYEGVASPLVDIYSLGATLHQLLTNTDPQEFRPFSFPQRPIRQYNPAVPVELEAIVMRALAYEASERWENMDALRAALQRVQRALENPGLPGAEARPTPAPTSPPLSPSATAPSSSSGLLARLRERSSTRPMAGGPADGGTRPVQTPPPASARPATSTSPGTGQRPAPEPLPHDGSTRPMGGQPSRTGTAAPTTPPARPQPARPPAPNGPTVGYDEGAIEGEAAIVPLWTFAAEEEVRSTPELTADALFIGSYDTNLYCLDRATGDFRWKYATNAGVPGTPSIWRELVIVGSEDYQVYGINRRTGRMEWAAQTQGRVRSSPRVALDHVFIGSDDGFVYAFTAARGHLVWKTSLGAPVRSTASLGEQLLFIGTEDGTVAGMDLQSGEAVWRVRAAGPVIASPLPVGQRVIAGSMDRQLYSIDQRSGWVVWRIRLSDRVYASPALEEERLYVCAVDGTLYCLEAEWGKEIWKLQLNTQVTSSPFVAPDGNLYIGGIDGALYCVNTRKGRVQWRFQTGGAIPGSPRVWENAVYFGSMDYRVYALPTVAAPRTFP